MKRITVIVPLLSMLGFACQKEPFWKKDKDPCELDFSIASCINAQWVQKGPGYFKPCFNPNNGDEIVFLEGNSPDAGVVKFNVRSGEKTTIMSGGPSMSAPIWGAQGWVTFCSGNNVNKLRDDGSEEAQLNFWGGGKYSTFNPTGDRILFARQFSDDDIPREFSKMVVSDLDGQLVDSFCLELGNDPCYPSGLFSWSPVGEEIALVYRGISLFDLDGNLKSTVYEWEESTTVLDIDWHPDGTAIFFVDKEGIKRIDIATGDVSLVRISCGNEFYGAMAISPDGRFLVAERRVSITSECLMTYVHSLSLMTTDGLNEETLPLP